MTSLVEFEMLKLKRLILKSDGILANATNPSPFLFSEICEILHFSEETEHKYLI